MRSNWRKKILKTILRLSDWSIVNPLNLQSTGPNLIVGTFSGPALFPGGQLDPDPPGRHSGASEAGEVLRADLQRDLALHPQRL